MVRNTLNASDSRLSWELEGSFGVAPAASAWRRFGARGEFRDISRKALRPQRLWGQGREASVIVVEGSDYLGELGTFQVIDPFVLGLALGEEVGAPVLVSGVFHRHTVTPTTNGQLPSFAVQGRDVSGASIDKTTYLGAVMSGVTIVGEEAAEDGSGGRLMFTPSIAAVNEDDTVADKTVGSDTRPGYTNRHGKITLWGEEIADVLGFRLRIDNQARAQRGWRDTNGDKPLDHPPRDVLYELGLSIRATTNTFNLNASERFIRQILANNLQSDATLRFVRTANEDEFEFNLTELTLEEHGKRRPEDGGPVVYDCSGVFKTISMEYIDTNSARFFPS